MDNEINVSVMLLSNVADKLRADGDLGVKEYREVVNCLAQIKEKMLEADKKYDRKHEH